MAPDEIPGMIVTLSFNKRVDLNHVVLVARDGYDFALDGTKVSYISKMGDYYFIIKSEKNTFSQKWKMGN